MVWKDTCPSVFIAALFTMAKTRKQPECSSADEWMNKMWYIHTMVYHSATEKNEIMPFATAWMDIEIVILSEVNQTEKEKYCMTSHTCGIKKKWYKWTYLQNRNRLTDLGNELMVARGIWGKRQEVWDQHVHTAIFKVGNIQGPTV